MKNKVEGTIILDGLIEGKLPANNQFRQHLDEWVTFAGRNHFPFHLEITGRSFSLLTDNNPVEVSKLESLPVELITGLLEQLMKIFPAVEQQSLFSTVRSLEYKRDLEIQTIYTVGPGGRIKAESREVDVTTHAPDKPLSRREKIGLGVISGMVIIVLLLISGLFIDYGAGFNRIKAELTPLDLRDLQVETGLFDRYLKIVGVKKGSNNTLLLTLERTSRFPRTWMQVEEAYGEAETLKEQLVLQSLAKGFVLYTIHTQAEGLSSTGRLNISSLMQQQELQVVIPYDAGYKPVKIVLNCL